MAAAGSTDCAFVFAAAERSTPRAAPARSAFRRQSASCPKKQVGFEGAPPRSAQRLPPRADAHRPVPGHERSEEERSCNKRAKIEMPPPLASTGFRICVTRQGTVRRTPKETQNGACCGPDALHKTHASCLTGLPPRRSHPRGGARHRERSSYRDRRRQLVVNCDRTLLCNYNMSINQ